MPPRRRGVADSRVVAEYEYLDEHRKLVYVVVRYQPKDFRTKRPDGDAGWAWNLSGTQRILYRLPELLAADPDQPVFVLEGEKDADALTRLGLVATCNPHGAGKWRDSYAHTLRDRDVVILPDNDDLGREHAEVVARDLDGIAKRVRLLELRGLPDKGDVTDWLEAGGTPEELLGLVSEIPAWRPRRGRVPTDQAADPPVGRPAAVPDTVADWLSEGAVTDDFRWVVERAVLMGSFTLLLGAPESFKSWGALWLARSALTGEEWLGRKVTVFDSVFYVGNEKTRVSLRERLRAVFGSFPQQVNERMHLRHRVGIQFGNDQWQGLRRDVRAREGTVLVILDTLTSLVKSGFDENTSRDASVVLSAIRDLMDGERVTVVLVHHPARAEADRPRGWSGLDGDVDGTITFSRLSKDGYEGRADINPKDAGHSRVMFKWHPSTSGFDVVKRCTPAAVANDVHEAHASNGEGLSTSAIAALYPDASPGTVKNVITAAANEELIKVGGKVPRGSHGGAPENIYVPGTGHVEPSR